MSHEPEDYEQPEPHLYTALIVQTLCAALMATLGLVLAVLWSLSYVFE